MQTLKRFLDECWTVIPPLRAVIRKMEQEMAALREERRALQRALRRLEADSRRRATPSRLLEWVGD